MILGPCAGGAVYSPALTDFVFVVDNISKMFITGPEVIKTVLGEEISMEDLGGARVHSEITGNAHFFAETEAECFDQIKKLISMIPRSNDSQAKRIEPKNPKPEIDIEHVVPGDPKQPYDIRDVVKGIVDDSEFLEVVITSYSIHYTKLYDEEQFTGAEELGFYGTNGQFQFFRNFFVGVFVEVAQLN